MTAATPGEFHGFRPAALNFLRGLRRHNEKGWFEGHRDAFDAELRLPLAALIEEMDVHFASIAPEIVGDPKRSPFRIHRDVRFSADKRPYKTHVACWFFHAGAGRAVGGAGTTDAHGGAGFYLHIEPERILVGGGIWMPPRPTLARLRQAIDEDHATLSRLLRAPAVRRRFGELAPEAMLTRMPRGYADSHPAATLLRHQSFTLGRTLTERELLGARLPKRLAGEYERLVPFVRWLNGALGLRALAHR